MISVIIPVYNVENYLHDCINSILKQSYDNFEIICVDDASTDSSLEILEYFAKIDSRIKILKNDSNNGPGFSRNRGLDVAEGKYISFLDGDDWLRSDAFEILIEKVEQDNLDLLLFKNIVYYDESQEFYFDDYYDMEFMNKYENQVFNHLDLDKTKLFLMSNAPWNKLYSKSFLDEYSIRFPNENLIHEDNPFFCKVITSAKRVSIIDKYIHIHRRRTDSIMTLNNYRLFDNIAVMYKVLEVFLEDIKLYEYYKKGVLRYISSVFYNKYKQIEEGLKDEFYRQVQEAYKVYIAKYRLCEDIKDSVDGEILDFFKFDDLVSEVIES